MPNLNHANYLKVGFLNGVMVVETYGIALILQGYLRRRTTLPFMGFA